MHKSITATQAKNKKQLSHTKVVTRFAPSPTGYLHIAGIRTALFAYAHAKKHNGTFILRLEDTDRERFVPGSGKEILDLLRKFKLDPDLYPTKNQLADMEAGKFQGYGNDWMLHIDEIEKIQDEDFTNVFVQTQRLPIYHKYVWQLIKAGYAYFCFCSAERLAKVNEEKKKRKEPLGYDGYCKRHYTIDEALDKIKKGEPYVVRMNVDKATELFGQSEITIKDQVVGDFTFDFKNVNDQVLIKSNGIPTYQFAVVVDDYLMGVTHIHRGFEWISSTPKQVFLYKALGWDIPKFVHLPIILDPSGGKLSKRKGTVAVTDFLKEGYLPDAILNFLMLLGWAPKKGDTREVFNLNEFVDLFSVNDLNKANPVFNRTKLLWFNSLYIRNKSNDELLEIFKDWLKETISAENKNVIMSQMLQDNALLDKLMLVKERVKTLKEMYEMLIFFYQEPTTPYNFKDVKGIKRYSTMTLYNALQLYMRTKELELEKDMWVSRVRDIADQFNIKHADMFMLIRLAVVGSPISPPLYETMRLISNESLQKRLNIYLDYLNSVK